jgi:gluconokinase
MIVIVMGTTGAGKTTVGGLLAKQLGWEFVDGDSFHPPANVAKMSQGIPLDDTDRRPWLAATRAAIETWVVDGRGVVLACSALKQAYREQLVVSEDVKVVYLKGTYQLFAERLSNRRGHFATEQLLASQFAAIEEPKDATTVDVGGAPEAIVVEIRSRLKLR